MANWLDRIKEKKRDLRMTNEALSDRSGIPIGTLNKILSGISDDPKLSTLTAFSKIFDVSIDYIAFGDADGIKLSESERELIENYRALDKTGRELVSMVAGKESERFSNKISVPEKTAAKILTGGKFKFTSDANSGDGESPSKNRFRLPIYDLPVSAGRGSLLDGSGTDFITLTSNGTTLGADFALRVSGDSMEPRYLDGDIILVHEQPSVGIGELGVFVCSDGISTEGYFKRFGGDRLISLNEKYDDIYLENFTSVVCRGRVIGRLPRQS